MWKDEIIYIDDDTNNPNNFITKKRQRTNVKDMKSFLE